MLFQAQHEANDGLQPSMRDEPFWSLIIHWNRYQLHVATAFSSMISGSWFNDPEIGLVQIESVKIQEISIVGRFFMCLTPMRSSIFHKVHQYSQPRKMSGFRSTRLFVFPGSSFLWSFSKAKFDQKVQRLRRLKFNMEPENNPLEKDIPFMETILFRFHVKLQGVKVTSNWSIVMPRSSVFWIRIGGVVLKAEKFARTWRLKKWKDVISRYTIYNSKMLTCPWCFFDTGFLCCYRRLEKDLSKTCPPGVLPHPSDGKTRKSVVG